MIDIMKAADIVISRSGAGTVCELMALKKKSVYIPLKIAQKNEQYHNAMEAHRKLGSGVIEEDQLKGMSIFDVLESMNDLDKEIENYDIMNGADFILTKINQSL